MAQQDLNTRFVTGKVRLSYVNLFTPRSPGEGQPEKYSVTIIIPKSDRETLDKIETARRNAIEKGRDRFAGGKVPKNLKNTLHDGDVDADLDRNPEYAGSYYMSVSANAQYRPTVVDQSVQPILDPAEVYSGCYARVSLNAFAYSKQGNQGVSFGLGNVQKLADGETLGGGPVRAENEFSAVAVDDDDDDDLL